MSRTKTTVAVTVVESRYKHAVDGWPLCPGCGKDRLYSPAAMHKMVTGGGPSTLAQVEACEMVCSECGWRSEHE